MKRALSALLLCGLMAFGMKVWLKTSNVFIVKNIRVKGNKILTREEVLNLAGLKPSQRIFSIDLKEVEERIKANPFVKRVKVVRYLPSSLEISLIEREPIALFKLHPVDVEGQLLPPLKGQRRLHLPLLTGMDIPEETLRGRVYFRGVLEAVNFLKKVRSFDPSLYADIHEVNLGSSKGMILYLHRFKAPIIIGKGEYRRKILYLKTLLKHIRVRGRIAYIDLRFEGQAVIGERR